MTFSGAGDPTVVAHLYIKSRSHDPLAEQLRVASLLTRSDLHPADLPPSAILCVRHLRDPLPGALLAQQQGGQPPSAWQRAVMATLTQCRQRAARPTLGSVPVNAAAVFFADRSELLACLAEDWLNGTATTRWWWQSFLKNDDVRRSVLAAWLAAPEYAPAALEYLAARRQAIAFVGALPASACQTLLQRIVHCFGLTALSNALATAAPETAEHEMNADIANHNAGNERNAAAHVAGLGTVVNSAPPWQRWAPEGASAQLSLEQQCLLATALLVQRTPTIVRTSAFAASVQQWRQRVHTIDQRTPVAGQPVHTVGAVQRPDAVKHTLGAEPITPALSDVHALRDGIAARQEELGDQQPAPQEASAEQASIYRGGQEVSGANPVSAPTPVKTPALMLAPAVHVQQEYALSSKPASAPPTSRVHALLDGVATKPAEPLERQPAMQQASAEQAAMPREGQEVTPAPALLLPMSRTIDTAFGGLFYLINLGIYLELYADFTAPLTPGIELNIYDFVALVAERLLGEVLRADPVWPLLAELAGRSVDQPAGQDFAPPGGQSLTAWLEDQMVAIRTRLVQALDLEENPALLPTLLCVHKARVAVSATHLDIFFALAELPIAIRLSGLDRNPGWVPAAGRYVTFYFE